MTMHIHPESLLPGNVNRDIVYSREGIYNSNSESTVLDIGCGTGFFTEKFQSNTRIGIDISIGNAAAARKLSDNVLVAVADAQCLPFQSNSFDLIFVSGVLEHFQNLDAFYMEVNRILKKNGRVYQTIDIRPKYTYLLWKFVFSLDWIYEEGHSMLHKIDEKYADEKARMFFDKEKFRDFLVGKMDIVKEVPIGGIFLNVFFTVLVTINILYSKIMKRIKLKEDCYGEYTPYMDNFVFKVYRFFVLPFITWLMKITEHQSESLYYLFVTVKKKE